MEPRLTVPQLTLEQAIAFAESRAWEHLGIQERAVFQLRQELCCMPFDVFHEALNQVLGRGIYTREFAKPDLLWQEMCGQSTPPTLADILAQLPADIRTIIVIHE